MGKLKNPLASIIAVVAELTSLTQNDTMRILHVTPWYPTEENQLHFLFIERQVKSLANSCQQSILHIDLSFDPVPRRSYEKDGVKRIQRHVPFNSWRLREWMFYRILKSELKKSDARTEFTHVNFFIAYPALIYFCRLEPYLPSKKMITEHWSAYHYNFQLSKIPDRLRKIFHHHIPVTCVSSNLGQDVVRFAGTPQKINVIPNVIETDIFHNRNDDRENHFLSVAYWKHPKKPLEILEVFRKKKLQGENWNLRIGGHGPDEQKILEFIKENRLEDVIQFIGKLMPVDLALELNRAKAFILPSEYETFSVIVAEALACGCPVIASRVGAIPDLINARNGVLVDDDWMEAFSKFETMSYDYKAISDEAIEKFNAEVIGAKLLKAFSEL